MEKLPTKNTYDSIPVNTVNQWLQSQHIFSLVERNMIQINRNVYTYFNIHNIRHAYNTALLAALIADYYNLSSEYRKILIDAALLHDIGRISDYYNYNHAYIGSIIVEDVLDNQPFYKNPTYLALIKALIYGHATSVYDNLAFRKNNIMPTALLTTLLKILKDADILDRTRLNQERLNIEHLNLNISKRLIEFAKYLNSDEVIARSEQKEERNALRNN